MTHSERIKVAVAKGDVDTVKKLLNMRLVYDPFKDGRTLLHIASQNGKLDVLEVLLCNGSNISAKDVNGYTPLHLASAQGHLEVIKVLLESSARVDDQDQYGNTAVHMAAWNGFSRSIELLVQFHANVNISNKAGFTALHTAAQKGHNQSARLLVYAGTLVNAKNKYGETPLHTCTRHGHAGVANILIKAKAKLNSKNKEGEACLHLAASLKRNKIARLIVEAGAKKSRKNTKGETAFEIAEKNNNTEIINMFQNHIVTKTKKLGLFNFLRRKTIPSLTRGRTLDPSLSSSISSSRNFDLQQNAGRGLFKAESFEEIQINRTTPAFNSLDRLGNSRRQRRKEVPTHQPSHHPLTQSWETSRQLPNMDISIQDMTYDTHEPRIPLDGRAAACGDYMNCWHSVGFVGAPGCCPVMAFPPPQSFVPTCNIMFGGIIPQYPVELHHRPHVIQSGLTNTIEQSMQYYRDLAGNLKQGPANVNRENVGTIPRNQVRSRQRCHFNPEDCEFEFDIDANKFIYQDHQIYQTHLYEPIGTHGLHEHVSNHVAEPSWSGGHTATKSNARSKKQVLPSNNQPDINGNKIPLEPRVIVRNELLGVGNNQPIYGNILTAEHHVQNTYNGQGNIRQRVRRPETVGELEPQPLVRCHSDETLSTVLGSSHARTKTRRSSYFRSKERQVRSNADVASTRNQSHERDPNASTCEPKINRDTKCGDLDEDYPSSESSSPEKINGEMRINSNDISISSSNNEDDDNDTPSGADFTPENHHIKLEELEGSPRKKHSSGNSDSVETLGSKDGTRSYPPIEMRRCRFSCDINQEESIPLRIDSPDTSAQHAETSLNDSIVSPTMEDHHVLSNMNSSHNPIIPVQTMKEIPKSTLPTTCLDRNRVTSV